jgi:hypothetical protein
VKLPEAVDTEKKVLNGELGSQKLPELEGVLSEKAEQKSDVIPDLEGVLSEKAEQKSDVKAKGVAPVDLRSPTEMLAVANGC